MLNRARKRKGIAPWYRFQAFWDSPIFKVQPYPGLETALVCTKGDACLIAIALTIDAKGFAIGLILGKVTAGPIRDVFRPPASAQMVLMPLWPVLWAIGFDQIL